MVVQSRSYVAGDGVDVVRAIDVCVTVIVVSASGVTTTVVEVTVVVVENVVVDL